MNIRDLLLDIKSPQAPVISEVVKALGVLETAQFGFSSDFLRHEYEVLKEDGEAAIRSVNGSIVSTMENTIMASVQLPSIQRLVTIDQIIKMKYGSLEAFLDSKSRTATYIRSIMQKLAQAVIYGDAPTFGVPGAFKGLRQIAKANGQLIGSLNGSSGSCTSIIAVHWAENETQIVIPEQENGNLVQMELVGGGTLQAPTADTTTGAKNLNYSVSFWTNAALQCGSKYSVAAIKRITSATPPTAELIDELIDAVKGMADGRTFLYMNRLGRRLVKQIKNTKLEITPSDTDYNTVVSSWDNIPIVLDEMIVSTETTDLD